jgi:hypothetical protein
MWGWVKQYVHPRIEAFSFELAPLLGGSRELITSALAGAPGFRRPLRRFAAHRSAPTVATTRWWRRSPSTCRRSTRRPCRRCPHAPLTAHELMAWDQQWQAWDAFATWLIKTVASHAGPRAARGAGRDLARSALRTTRRRSPTMPSMPTRCDSLFVHAWQRLTPLLGEAQLAVQGDEAPALSRPHQCRRRACARWTAPVRRLACVSTRRRCANSRACCCRPSKTTRCAIPRRRTRRCVNCWVCRPNCRPPREPSRSTDWLAWWIQSAQAADYRRRRHRAPESLATGRWRPRCLSRHPRRPARRHRRTGAKPRQGASAFHRGLSHAVARHRLAGNPAGVNT